MRRDYIDLMKTGGFGEFLTACDNLKNSKYVIAETKITALLKAVADNKQIYSMFGAALCDFDYKREFTDCVSGHGFSLPSDPQKAIALVFRILIDIDNGKMPLANFLEAYFYSESLNESYARFGLEVIAPFESYCRMYFTQADAAAANFLSSDNGHARAYEKASANMQEELKTDALACVASLIELAEGSIAGVIDCAEYVSCLNGLIRAIKSDDYDDVISSFLGVKYAVAYFFKSDARATELYKKLEYAVKHFAD